MKAIMKYFIGMRPDKRNELRVANGILIGIAFMAVVLSLRGMELGVYVQEQVDRLFFFLAFLGWQCFWGLVLKEAESCVAKMR